MRRVIVRYTVKPGRADENEKLVRAVYEELDETKPEGLRYATLRLDDGVSFVHLSESEADTSPLAEVPAFKAFQTELAGVDEPLAAGDGARPRTGVQRLPRLGEVRWQGGRRRAVRRLRSLPGPARPRPPSRCPACMPSPLRKQPVKAGRATFLNPSGGDPAAWDWETSNFTGPDSSPASAGRAAAGGRGPVRRLHHVARFGRRRRGRQPVRPALDHANSNGQDMVSSPRSTTSAATAARP